MCKNCNQFGEFVDGEEVWNDCSGVLEAIHKEPEDDFEPICACNVCGYTCSQCI